MKALLIVECILLALLYFLSKNRYKDYMKTQEVKYYSFTSVLPLALFILEKINYKYNSKYDKKIIKILGNLYGPKVVDVHMKLYYGSKLVVMLAAMFILTLFGAISKQADLSYIIFTLCMPLLIFYLYDKDLEKKQKKKYDSIRADFPDLVSKLVLLVNAGMTLNRAWEKICLETNKKTPLYMELKLTYMQIQGGRPEGEAYEEFARRCRVREIAKFVTLVIQNLKKGSGDLVPLLKLEADECWELRKMRARQLGEEASTKLILPMMIMFIGILIIVILPAVLQLSNL